MRSFDIYLLLPKSSVTNENKMDNWIKHIFLFEGLGQLYNKAINFERKDI